MNVVKADRTTNMYQIRSGDAAERAKVESWLCGLDLVSPDVKDAIVTAWVSSWHSSPYATLEEMPFTPAAPTYLLHKHVVEVGDFGVTLARSATEKWGTKVEYDQLVPILLLHDIDKPLMYLREDKAVTYSPLYKQLPHGVVGAMMLHDIGFPDIVVNTVATHSGASPFHGSNFEAYVLHYADYFSADHARMLDGAKATYQRHLMP